MHVFCSILFCIVESCNGISTLPQDTAAFCDELVSMQFVFLLENVYFCDTEEKIVDDKFCKATPDVGGFRLCCLMIL